MTALRIYLNRRSVRETLFVWVLLYLGLAAFVPHALTGAILSTILCVPAYLFYRIARFLFVNRFPRTASKLNIQLRKI